MAVDHFSSETDKYYDQNFVLSKEIFLRKQTIIDSLIHQAFLTLKENKNKEILNKRDILVLLYDKPDK